MYIIELQRDRTRGIKRIKFSNSYRAIRFYKRFRNRYDFKIKEGEKVIYDNVA